MERCTGNSVFTSQKAVNQILEVFPHALELFTQGDLRSLEEPGVYVLDMGEYRVVRTKGICPHFSQGDCSAGLPCPVLALLPPNPSV